MGVQSSAGGRGPIPDISLSTPLSLRTSFLFPLQDARSRREVIIGGLWLLVPMVGWFMNMGHRIVFVHHMMHGRSPWPAWGQPLVLLKHGLITWLGMVLYYAPATAVGWWAFQRGSIGLGVAAVLLWIPATIAIPGYMSHYCRAFDPREIFNPLRALRRCFEGGTAYWRAWGIALAALALSFAGLLAFGLGFLFTSVWFWQVAGFSFATVFTRQFNLAEPEAG
ncbi:MAG: hypothetical protein AB8G96_16215 [Phycisphaerales bacterium]